ncbi:MAG: hypothetical protein OXH65_07085 [Paracoccaceae bacterium]|nr:hypothetical protein [Paracoccaceae bacterium]MDE2674856.1 hypothetical protein [Paracoccaceae bacterium]
MRKRVRLSGRIQLPPSSIKIDFFVTDAGNTKITLIITNKKIFDNFPPYSKKKIRITENRFSEIIDFGILDGNITTKEIKNKRFSVPTCQFRLVSTKHGEEGKILASTKDWNLKKSLPGPKPKEGMLHFQPQDIYPQFWKLEIREDDYPIVYIDKNIPNISTWVRTNPIFLGCVLPVVIKEIFHDILEKENLDEDWELDWIEWAKNFTTDIPEEANREERKEWIDNLIDSFCSKHEISDKIRQKLVQVE